MDEEEFRRLLKEQEDAREKAVAFSRSSHRGAVIELNINVKEFMKKFEEYIEEMEKEQDSGEFYFEDPRQKKKYWRRKDNK